MILVEDQSKITLELCELMAAEGYEAVIKSGNVVYFVEKMEDKNNGKCR